MTRLTATQPPAGVLTLRAPAITAGDLVAELSAVLTGAGIPDARAEARDVVAALLDEPRFWPNLHPESPLPAEVVSRARDAAAMRSRGAPFAYAVGRAAFRHLVLTVDERVLIPRQETELLVDLVLELAGSPGGVVADVGTGSGAIALALASEGSFERVIATDVASDALLVARENARRLAGRLRAPVEFRSGAGLAPLGAQPVDVLVSNPPYIALGEAGALPESVRAWEPVTALMAGGDGLAVIRDIIRGAPAVLAPGGLLALEVDARRAHVTAELVRDAGGFGVAEVRPDLTGRDRFVVAIRT